MSGIYKYPLKIDTVIMDAIKRSAEDNGRSVNKEIEFILKKYAERNGYLSEKS